MKIPVNIFTIWLLSTPVLLLSACKPTSERPGIVVITTEPEVTLFNCQSYEFVAASESGRLAAYLPDYSMLAIEFQSEAFMYLYRLTDGRDIHLRIEGDLLYVDDTVRSISLESDEIRNFATWYASATKDDLQSIQSIEVCSQNLDRYRTELQAMGEANPSIRHFLLESGFEGKFNDPPKPIFLSSDMNIAFEDLDLSEVKYLILEENLDPEAVATSHRQLVPNLHRLVLFGNAETKAVLDLLPGLKAITDWNWGNSPDGPPNLEKLHNLQELHIGIGDSDEILDLSQLPNPEALRALSLSGDWSQVRGHEFLTNLEYLNPGVISEDQLESIISKNPNLIFLNLISTKVEDLKAIAAATRLEGLALGETLGDFDFTPLRTLEHLRYISLPEQLYDDPEIAARIRTSCPKCVIYGQVTFCLGSGWLILRGCLKSAEACRRD
jgi:hypothetical protein